MQNFYTNDIFCFIGLKNPDNTEVIAIPFIFNENHSKIKTLTDNKIFTIKEDKLIQTVKTCMEKEYNAKHYAFSVFQNFTKIKVLPEEDIKNYIHAIEVYFKNKITIENFPELDF